MSTRLQVVMDEEEAEKYKRAAARRQLTLSEWVRECLRQSLEREPRATTSSKLAAIDRAQECHHPTGSIEDMLRQIEEGRDLR